MDKFSVHYEYEGFEYEINEVQKCIRDGLLESPQISLSSSLATIEMIDKLIN